MNRIEFQKVGLPSTQVESDENYEHIARSEKVISKEIAP